MKFTSILFALSLSATIFSSTQNVAFADTSVEWSPSDALTLTLNPGDQTTVDVSLVVMKDIGDVTLEVVPELDAFIDVSPASFDGLEAGDQVDLSITATIPQTAEPTLLMGTLKVRQSVQRRGKGKVFARPLPIEVLIEEEEGVAAADDNGNGVWDYVDEFIDSEFGGDGNEPVRAAARQFASALQNGLLNAEDKDQAINFASQSDRAAECMFYVNPDAAYDALAALEAHILNSESRSLAFLMFSEQSAGQVFPGAPYSQRSASCD